MEQQNSPKPEGLNPTSRKTNEEIEVDDQGNLIIGGEKEAEKSLPSDGPISKDGAEGKNSLGDQQTHVED